MTLLRNHLWLTGLLVMFVNIVIGRARMSRLIADGKLTAREANSFCINAAVVLTVVCVLFEVVASTTGLPVECQFLLPLTHHGLWPGYALTMLSGAVLLYWLWRRGGDQTLAKVGPAFARGDVRGKKYTPRQVRLWLTALPVIAWGGFIAVRLMVPMPALAEMPFCSEHIAAQTGGAPGGASPVRQRPE